MASHCLPAQLDKSNIKILKELSFNARILDPGEHLCRQGNKIDSIYLIRSGLLKSYINKENGDEFIMDFHLPPELFGWEGNDSKQLSLSIVALDHSNICEIPTLEFSELISQNTLLQQQFFKLIQQRIRNDNLKFLRTTAEQRVANFIVQFSNHYKLMGFPYYMCKLIMTHQDIANYLRIAPATISRILHQMQKKGLIVLKKKDIYLNDIDKLNDIATGLIPDSG